MSSDETIESGELLPRLDVGVAMTVFPGWEARKGLAKEAVVECFP